MDNTSAHTQKVQKKIQQQTPQKKNKKKWNRRGRQKEKKEKERKNKEAARFSVPKSCRIIASTWWARDVKPLLSLSTAPLRHTVPLIVVSKPFFSVVHPTHTCNPRTLGAREVATSAVRSLQSSSTTAAQRTRATRARGAGRCRERQAQDKGTKVSWHAEERSAQHKV